MVLGSLGVAGDTDARARLVEDLDDLLGEVVDDLYLRAFAYGEDEPVFTHAEAMAIARDRGRRPAGPARAGRPRTAPHRPAAGSAFADAVRAEIDRRKRRLGILSYDDLLSQLADALADDDAPARARMRQRWRIVLVDEFQDTDPVQWQVLDRAFTGHATMVLIGDPKQAIYAFRGGDVTTYLAGRRHRRAPSRRSRSTGAATPPLLDRVPDAARAAPRSATRGSSSTTSRPTTTSGRLAGAPQDAPFRLRVVRREQFRAARSPPLTVGQVRPHIARRPGPRRARAARLAARPSTGDPLEPRDVAVIGYRHADLAAAQAALHEVGVPAVIAGGGSVFATPAAVEWLPLLEALEQPHRSARVRAAALTCFFGHTAAELDAAAATTSPTRSPTAARPGPRCSRRRGVAAVLEAATAGGLPGRVLAEVGGERQLTDLRHIGEALHEVALTERLGLVSLLAWLREQVAEGRAGRGRRAHPPARLRRGRGPARHHPRQQGPASTPSSTSRRSPTATSRSRRRPLFHDDEGRRCVDVGGGAAPTGATTAAAGPTRRPASGCGCSTSPSPAPSRRSCAGGRRPRTPRARRCTGCCCAAPGEADVPDAPRCRTDDEAVELFARWRDRGGPAPEPADARRRSAPTRRSRRRPASRSARFDPRRSTPTWRRTSYSSLEPGRRRGRRAGRRAASPR